jgi:hypothetical protein
MLRQNSVSMIGLSLISPVNYEALIECLSLLYIRCRHKLHEPRNSRRRTIKGTPQIFEIGLDTIAVRGGKNSGNDSKGKGLDALDLKSL